MEIGLTLTLILSQSALLAWPSTASVAGAKKIMIKEKRKSRSTVAQQRFRTIDDLIVECRLTHHKPCIRRRRGRPIVVRATKIEPT